MSVLLLVMSASALAVIYCKYNARTLFIEIQKLKNELDIYEVEWGRLQLELSTLAEQGRIESLGREQLDLVLPEREAIVYVKP